MDGLHHVSQPLLLYGTDAWRIQRTLCQRSVDETLLLFIKNYNSNCNEKNILSKSLTDWSVISRERTCRRQHIPYTLVFLTLFYFRSFS